MAILIESSSHAPTSAHFLLKDWPAEDSLPCHILGAVGGKWFGKNHRLFYLMEAREPSLSSEWQRPAERGVFCVWEGRSQEEEEEEK